MNLLIAAAEVATKQSSWTVYLGIAGIVAGAIGAWLGYRGQSKSANASEVAAIFEGQTSMIHNLQEELKRHVRDQEKCDRELAKLRQRLADIEELNQELREELHSVLSDFSGLQMIVQDEIARAAASMTIERANSTLDQTKRDPSATEGETPPSGAGAAP